MRPQPMVFGMLPQLMIFGALLWRLALARPKLDNGSLPTPRRGLAWLQDGIIDGAANPKHPVARRDDSYCLAPFEKIEEQGRVTFEVYTETWGFDPMDPSRCNIGLKRNVAGCCIPGVKLWHCEPRGPHPNGALVTFAIPERCDARDPAVIDDPFQKPKYWERNCVQNAIWLASPKQRRQWGVRCLTRAEDAWVRENRTDPLDRAMWEAQANRFMEMEREFMFHQQQMAESLEYLFIVNKTLAYMSEEAEKDAGKWRDTPPYRHPYGDTIEPPGWSRYPDYNWASWFDKRPAVTTLGPLGIPRNFSGQVT